MAHTPGPWRPYFYVGNRRLRTGQWGLIGGDGFPLFCNGVKENCGNSAEDIRLAAAAPELLAALKEIVAYDEGSNKPGDFGYEVLQRCKTAIAKAEGRSK